MKFFNIVLPSVLCLLFHLGQQGWLGIKKIPSLNVGRAFFSFLIICLCIPASAICEILLLPKTIPDILRSWFSKVPQYDYA